MGVLNRMLLDPEGPFFGTGTAKIEEFSEMFFFTSGILFSRPGARGLKSSQKMFFLLKNPVFETLKTKTEDVQKMFSWPNT